MGRTYLFECPKCSYKAKVAGKPEQGFCFWVQTVQCRDCRALHDAVTKLKVPETSPLSGWRLRRGLRRLQPLARPALDGPPTFDAALNHLLYTGSDRSRWVQFRLRCPVAHYHRVEAWSDPGKCPRCGTFLEKSATPYRIWD